MAEFLKDSQVISSLEDLIDKAEDYLWLISPYIKLHDRIKDRLKLKKNLPHLRVIIIFGKNEDDTSKSLTSEDFNFLKGFPNITIGYEKRLHAKYYASEDFSIISSMNLHEFSQNNNIEVAIKLKSKSWLQAKFAAVDVEDDCFNYFLDVVENCQVIFRNEPEYKSGLLGLTSSYINSKILTDESENFFKKKEAFQGRKYNQFQKIVTSDSATGFCIRTGKPIPFNPSRPMCKEAYDSWNQFKNPDYSEKFCHKTGKPSNGRTSMKNPIL